MCIPFFMFVYRVIFGSTFVLTIRNKRGVRIMATREVEKSCSTREMSSS